MVIIQHTYNVSTNSHSGTKLHSFPSSVQRKLYLLLSGFFYFRSKSQEHKTQIQQTNAVSLTFFNGCVRVLARTASRCNLIRMFFGFELIPTRRNWLRCFLNQTTNPGKNTSWWLRVPDVVWWLGAAKPRKDGQPVCRAPAESHGWVWHWFERYLLINKRTPCFSLSLNSIVHLISTC